jgi:hypothetical protein
LNAAVEAVSHVQSELVEVIQVTTKLALSHMTLAFTLLNFLQLLQNAKEEKDALLQRNRSAPLSHTHTHTHTPTPTPARARARTHTIGFILC